MLMRSRKEKILFLLVDCVILQMTAGASHFTHTVMDVMNPVYFPVVNGSALLSKRLLFVKFIYTDLAALLT